MASDTAEATLYRYRFGKAEYDASRLMLLLDNTPVNLEQRPLQVLAALLHRADEAVTREELFDAVWAGRPTVDNVLPNAMAKLRKALGEDGARIQTLPRVGYRLNGPVERVATGRHAILAMNLSAGQPVAGREHFHLREALDQPGGGHVWLARHDKTGEARVYKFATDGRQLAALKREVTIHRVLREELGERDDFVRLIDWNFDTPPFHIECEYGGRNLLQWAQETESFAAMALDRRIAMFLQIADAVAAAHRVDVLHTDLKPANVLVAEHGSGVQLRLADFGSGQLREPERLDALGITRLGFTISEAFPEGSGITPLYVAPELLTGAPPTIASDVYALGLILFQMVVGDLRRPLAPGWERDIDDELLREDIAAATDGQPGRRLASAALLGERLRGRRMRYAERDRLRAAEARALHAERMLDRSQARRPWIIVALVLLVTGLGASLWQYRRVRVARDDAQQQAAIAQASNRFLNEDLLGAGIGDDSPAWYERNPSLREILDAAAQRLDTRFAGEPLLLAGLHQTLGRAYRSTGAFARAATQLQAAATLFAHTLPAGDSRTLLAQYELAGVLANLSQFREAHLLLDAADAARPAHDQVTELALRSHLARGDVLYQQMQVTPALGEYRSAENLQKLLHPDDAALSAHLLLAIAGCELRLGQPDAAEKIARIILAGAPYTQTRIGLGAIATARSRLGNALRGQGRYNEAIPVTQQALADYEQAEGRDSQGAISALSTLGYLYSLSGDNSKALLMQRDVYQRSLQRWGADNQYTLVELLNLGSAEYDAGDAASALPHLQQASTGLARISGTVSPTVQAAYVAQANALSDLGRNSEALALIGHIDPKAYQATTSDPGRAAVLQAIKARILLRLGHRREGEPLMREALSRMQADGVAASEIGPFRRSLDQATASR